jgi:hypothetical protein
MTSQTRERAHDRITALAGQGLDLVSFWRDATEIIEPVVPHYMGPCWFTLDPASLLITSHFNDDMPALPPESLALEYYEDDVNKLADVARSPSGVQGESTATIAQRLVVSAHTVQQHLKSIFEKTGVHSRRDLVGKVFFSYYEPRLRDNESRVPQDKPLRGEPMAPA